MAVKPGECGKLTDADRGEVDRLEALIDMRLREEFFPAQGRSTVTWDPPKGMNRRVSATLLSRYRAAGWTVAVKSHQIDGDWWEFKDSEAA